MAKGWPQRVRSAMSEDSFFRPPYVDSQLVQGFPTFFQSIPFDKEWRSF